jgi:hypothetical protein
MRVLRCKPADDLLACLRTFCFPQAETDNGPAVVVDMSTVDDGLS